MGAQFVWRTSSAVILAGPTALGHAAVAVAGNRLAGVSFAHESGPQGASRLARMLGGTLEAGELLDGRDDDERLATDILDRLALYLEGEPLNFNDVPLADDHLSTFQRRVVAACRAIPFGATRTYGELAARAGSPGAARAVGQVMKGNRAPLIVPCHRVVAAGGKLGGFSAPQGLALKRRLLVLEGASVGHEPLFKDLTPRHVQSASASFG